MESLDALLHEALVITALIALPVLTVSAIVGTVIAVVQAATQVQEQTLTLLPKVLAVGLVMALFGTRAMQLLAEFFDRAVSEAPRLVGW